jgi:hypothetical protein
VGFLLLKVGFEGGDAGLVVEVEDEEAEAEEDGEEEGEGEVGGGGWWGMGYCVSALERAGVGGTWLLFGG